MHVHLVFVTKNRHSVFADRHLTRCEEVMRAVCGGLEGLRRTSKPNWSSSTAIRPRPPAHVAAA
ncbi:transposase [Streptomyces sp. NPDC059582]|uniref:transposase n=1 Tax=Streptomyces sp. NPDC059582 TaxID=3346875 RepID=UPI0036B152C2